jgi:hypothetical protein
MDAGKRKGLSAELQTFTKAEATIEWNPQRDPGTLRFRTASDYRRPRNAEVTHDGRRGLAGNRNAAHERASSLLTANRRRVAAAQRARWAKMKRAG